MAVLLALWLTIPSGGNSLSQKGPGTGTKGGVLFSVPLKVKVVALTFDDGPSLTTPVVLDILREHSAKCTFFTLGKEIRKYPNIARRILAEGHELGGHTFSHLYLRGRAEARLKTELETSERLFAETLGVRPTLFRFPGLSYTADLVKVAQNRGYTVVSCSLDTYDWRIKDPAQVARRVTSMIQPGDIVLMHDGDWVNPKNVTLVLKETLRYLRDNGYRCVTVSELINLGLREKPGQPLRPSDSPYSLARLPSPRISSSFRGLGPPSLP